MESKELITHIRKLIEASMAGRPDMMDEPYREICRERVDAFMAMVDESEDGLHPLEAITEIDAMGLMLALRAIMTQVALSSKFTQGEALRDLEAYGTAVALILALLHGIDEGWGDLPEFRMHITPVHPGELDVSNGGYHA